MKQKVIQHKYLHNIVLGIILGFSLLMFSMLSGKPDLQLMIGFVAALSYVLWGIIYHLIDHDLYPRVVLEYVLMSSVGLVLLYTVLSV